MYARTVVAGIVMAAGASERMGQTKQLLPFGDTTLLGWVVRSAEASVLDEVLVITGFQADEVERSLEPHRARFVRNPQPERGNHSSLLCGLEATPANAAAMIILGDMPAVSPDVIDGIIDRWRQAEPWAAVASYSGVRAHPFLLSPDAVKEVPSLHGRRPLWRLLDSGERSDILEVTFARQAPRDVDTRDDYHAVLRQFGFDGGLPQDPTSS